MAGIVCPWLPSMVNSPMAIVTEGHERNVIKTPSRWPSVFLRVPASVPAIMTTTSSRHLLLRVRPGAARSTKSYPALRTSIDPTSVRNAAGRISREPQQPYQIRPLSAVAAALLAYPASTQSAICMPACLLHKSSFAKTSLQEWIYIYIYIYIIQFANRSLWIRKGRNYG